VASRRRTLLWLILALLAAGGGWAAWWQLIGRFYETTDNAYVAGNLIEVTPQVAGTVVAIGADDTDRVQAGQMLVRWTGGRAGGATGGSRARARGARTRTLYATT
jgi:membrane fusion protein (multidrug efflux system)